MSEEKKKPDVPPKEKEEDRQSKLEKHRKSVVRHKDEVLKNCILLAERIMELEADDKSEFEKNLSFGRSLIIRGYSHDNSKLFGVEWNYLMKGEELMQLAHRQHVLTNDHHPEYWLEQGMTLLDMPAICWAECVCDWKARSSEFGSDLRSWVKDEALDKWDIPPSGKVYKRIKYYLDLLLDEAF